MSALFVNGLLAVVIERGGPDLRDPEYRLMAEALRAKRAAEPAAKLTLVLGSSRTALGVDAGRLSTPDHTVFNFGMPGAGPYMMNVHWDRLAAEGITPDRLVIEVMHPFYNAASRRALDVGFMDASRLNFSEATGLAEYGRQSAGPLRRLGIARLFPAGRHGIDLADRAGLKTVSVRSPETELFARPDANGYRPRFFSPERREALRVLAHQQYDPFYPTFAENTVASSRLRELIRKAQAGGATVSLLLTPEGSEFRAMTSPAMAAAIRQFTDGLAAEFGVAVIDARDWLPDAAFYDQHHLLPAGGTAFAEKLKPLLP